MAEKLDLGKNICAGSAKSIHRPRTIRGVRNVDAMNLGVESEAVRCSLPAHALGEDAHAFDVSDLSEDSLDEAPYFSSIFHVQDYARRPKNSRYLFDELTFLSRDEVEPKFSSRLK